MASISYSSCKAIQNCFCLSSLHLSFGDHAIINFPVALVRRHM